MTADPARPYEGMDLCPRCGRLVFIENRWCRHCGAPLGGSK